MPVHRYEDALFHQTEHLRFLNSGYGVRFYETFERAMRQREYENDTTSELPEGLTYGIARRITERAEPAFVSAQVVETINAAKESFEPEPLLPTDLFTMEGFAYMPSPIYVTDAHDEQTPIRAMAWMPVRGQLGDGMEQGGVWVIFFTHRDDDRPGLMGQTAESIAKFRTQAHASLTPLHSFWMPFNQLPAPPSDPRFARAAREQWCAVQVLWRLAAQVVKTIAQAPRQARRDAKRHGVDQDHVVVVTLRKVKSIVSGGNVEETEAEGGHLTVQFPVRGHWRNQWYPSVSEHRQLWIDGYWKGPEDAPVQNSRRVFEVIR